MSEVMSTADLERLQADLDREKRRREERKAMEEEARLDEFERQARLRFLCSNGPFSGPRRAASQALEAVCLEEYFALSADCDRAVAAVRRKAEEEVADVRARFQERQAALGQEHQAKRAALAARIWAEFEAGLADEEFELRKRAQAAELRRMHPTDRDAELALAQWIEAQGR